MKIMVSKWLAKISSSMASIIMKCENERKAKMKYSSMTNES
jgi:hypothetical protein